MRDFKYLFCVLLLTFPALAGFAAGNAAEQLLADWRGEADHAFTAAAGERLWFYEVNGRSCTSCHTEDPRVVGRHQKTGKPIEPLAPSANAERLTDVKKIKKWLYRNCKWTFERECTAQEKGDVLTWLLLQ